MPYRALLLLLLGFALSGCTTYDYAYADDDRHYDGRYYGDSRSYNDSSRYRSQGAYRYYGTDSSRYYGDRDYRRQDYRRYDKQRYDQPRYYRGQDGQIHQYKQLRGHDRPRYVAPPKNAQKHYQQNNRSGYRQDMRSAPPGSYRGGPRY
ncbi:hypothetical protein NVV93_05000 [Pseudomonas sp. LS44]|uniref:hypothetical protein n=1 Tax=Pseudomonas sp. LS44 TaxID=1357074 RepID=UPI00215B4532|nr:hypothetical protein [Pseudomonas sp. LS44]UVE18750.1 hypothetical protein NVV93_05000 [Pseudomonas sp. LS44]